MRKEGVWKPWGVALSLLLLWGGGTSFAQAAEVSAGPRARAEQHRQRRELAKRWIEVPEVSVDEARDLVGDPGVVFIDVTCEEKAAKIREQIVGSSWRDCTKVEQWAPQYADATTIVVYCACKEKPKSARVVQKLTRLGFTNAYHLEGGWFAWRDAGYPMEAKP